MTSTLNIGLRIYAHSRWLEPEIVGKADEALTAHESRSYTQAVMNAGVCLEKLLSRELRQRAAQLEGKPTLGALIGKVRDSSLSHDALLRRLDEANNIRNRAAHEKESELDAITEGDSLYMLNIVAKVVDWLGGQRGQSNPDHAVDLVPVFLSVGGAHRLEQAQFLQHLRTELRRLGVDVRNLSAIEYSEDRPFDQVRELLKTCRGALIVGLERSHAYAVFERERSDREQLYQDQYTPTAWNQIEGAMASALGLSVLVLREQRLHLEGIFEVSNSRHVVFPFDLGVESRKISSNLLHLLTGWVGQLRSVLDSARTPGAPAERSLDSGPAAH
jgi:hypothetical protein